MPTRDELAHTGRRAVEDARGRLSRAADTARGEWGRGEGRSGVERIGKALSSGVLALAGRKPAALAAEERRRSSGNGRRPPATKRAFPDVVDLDAVTRDELYERAKKLDVPGRSKMSKQDLARAVAERGG